MSKSWNNVNRDDKIIQELENASRKAGNYVRENNYTRESRELDTIQTYSKINHKYVDFPKMKFSSIDRTDPETNRKPVPYMSAPQMSDIKLRTFDVDKESKLKQGLVHVNGSEIKEYNYSSFHFNYLPSDASPQNVSHIIPPSPANGGWVRGGDNTRDYTRRLK